MRTKAILKLRQDHVGVKTPAGLRQWLHLHARQSPSGVPDIGGMGTKCNVARLTPMETRPVGKHSPYGVDELFVRQMWWFVRESGLFAGLQRHPLRGRGVFSED